MARPRSLPTRVASQAQKGGAAQAGDEVEQHEQPGLGVVVAADLAEEEEQQRAGDARRHAQQQVGDQQFLHHGRLQQRQIGAQAAVRLVAGGDGLGHGDHGQADGDGQGDDDGPAHDPHPVGIGPDAGLDHHGRQDQDQHHPDDVEHLPPAVDAAALIILGREDGGPAQLAQGADGEAEVEEQQPAEQIEGGAPGWTTTNIMKAASISIGVEIAIQGR